MAMRGNTRQGTRQDAPQKRQLEQSPRRRGSKLSAPARVPNPEGRLVAYMTFMKHVSRPALRRGGIVYRKYHATHPAKLRDVDARGGR